jgi:hypothetical protein
MPLLLELTLVLVLLAIGGALVSLLFQLRRTAQGLDAFLLSTRKDLLQITEDVHASRLRMDHLGISLQYYLDEISGFIAVARDVKEGVTSFTGALRRALDPASNPFAGIIGGITAVMTLFRRNRAKREPEPEPKAE